MEELDLKELISMFMKRKVLIIFVVIIFAILGAVYTMNFITPTYQSSTSLVLVQTGTEGRVNGDTNSITTTDITLNSKLVDTYRVIASSDSVLLKVIEKLDLNMTKDQLAKIVSVTTRSDAEVIEITVQYTDPELACAIAKEVANTFIENTNQIYKLNNLYILDIAEVASEPSNIHLSKNIVIFAFVGGILVSGYILLVNMLDTTVKSDTDIEKALNVPVLASIVLMSENTNPKKNQKRTKKENLNKGNNIKKNNYINQKQSSIFENYGSLDNKENYKDLDPTNSFSSSKHNLDENENRDRRKK